MHERQWRGGKAAIRILRGNVGSYFNSGVACLLVPTEVSPHRELQWMGGIRRSAAPWGGTLQVDYIFWFRIFLTLVDRNET